TKSLLDLWVQLAAKCFCLTQENRAYICPLELLRGSVDDLIQTLKASKKEIKGAAHCLEVQVLPPSFRDHKTSPT
ncbi:unnamed protein product, partial [Brassica rapa subsp. narinosa]